ncbi:hypothetical protein [Providencia rustigianii]|uniref:hypothetical protein n=1 Tax=Providencia rustigianii TaxID=158850 RepID=UPI002244F2A7|nr:hypothetical protein [Providencia rustigianii]
MSGCVCCGKPLRNVVWSADETLKSCPRCSQTHGSMHVFRHYPADFGNTSARVTRANPDGSQSHCVDCRTEDAGAPSHVDFSITVMCDKVVQGD